MTSENSTKFEWRNGRLYIVQLGPNGSTHVVVITPRQFAEMAASALLRRAA